MEQIKPKELIIRKGNSDETGIKEHYHAAYTFLNTWNSVYFNVDECQEIQYLNLQSQTYLHTYIPVELSTWPSGHGSSLHTQSEDDSKTLQSWLAIGTGR